MNEMKNGNRIKYIDYTKGLTIILMVLVHSMPHDNSLKKWICSFFMPIFFIISGFLVFRKYDGENIGQISIKDVALKRLYQLGIPYLIFSSVLALFYSFLQFISAQEIHILEYCFRIISLQGIDSLWFLPIFYFAELTLIFFVKNKRVDYLAVLWTIITILLMSFGKEPFFKGFFYQHIAVYSVCFVFEWIGFCIGKWKILERNDPLILYFSILIIGYISSQYNELIGIRALWFGKGWLTVLNATLTSIALLGIAKCFEKLHIHCKLLEYYGKNSIVVLCTNNLVIEMLRLLDSKITGSFLLQIGVTGDCIFAIIVLLIEFYVIKLSRGRMGIIYGKPYKRK